VNCSQIQNTELVVAGKWQSVNFAHLAAKFDAHFAECDCIGQWFGSALFIGRGLLRFDSSWAACWIITTGGTFSKTDLAVATD
jgi:hypothetical protein